MDPNETLRQLRDLMVKLETGWDHFSEDDVDELVEKWKALDEWLSSGGFHPREWKRTR
jgi:hypothetical protein